MQPDWPFDMDREALLRHLDEGTAQLRRGEGIELRGDEELRQFFDEINAEGRRRYQARFGEL